MPRRALEYRMLKALEEERDLSYLDAVQGLKQTTVENPWGNFPGTLPEMIVYKFLVNLGVQFFFQWQMDLLPGMEKWSVTEAAFFIPDFFLPDYKTVIEVQGTYWHSSDESVYSDRRKAVIYEAEGLKYFFWDEIDIYHGVENLFQRDLPFLLGGLYRGRPQIIFDQKAKFESIKFTKARQVKMKMRPIIVPRRVRAFKLKRKAIQRQNQI